MLVASCSSSQPKVDPKAAPFCAAYKAAQQAVIADYTPHPELFQQAADIAPADIKAAADQVVVERQAAVNSGSTTQGTLDGLTPSGIKVQMYCSSFWGATQ